MCRQMHTTLTEIHMQKLAPGEAGHARPSPRQGELLEQLQRLAAELCCQGGHVEAQPQVRLPRKDALQQVRDLQGLSTFRLMLCRSSCQQVCPT